MSRPPPCCTDAAQFGGHRAGIEVFGVGGDAPQRGGELRLGEAVAGFVEVAIALEDATGIGERGEILGRGEAVRFLVGKNVARGCQANGRGHHASEAEVAVSLLRVDQAGDGAGHADGFVADGGSAGDDIAVRVEIHGCGGSGGGLLAVVDEVGRAGMHADEHEAAATQVAGLGKDDGEGESNRDGRVDCIAAGFQDFDTRVGGVVVDADHHRMLRARGLRADDGVRIGRICRRCLSQNRGCRQCEDEGAHD